jgi:hypothetical protein
VPLASQIRWEESKSILLLTATIQETNCDRVIPRTSTTEADGHAMMGSKKAKELLDMLFESKKPNNDETEHKKSA